MWWDAEAPRPAQMRVAAQAHRAGVGPIHMRREEIGDEVEIDALFCLDEKLEHEFDVLLAVIGQLDGAPVGGSFLQVSEAAEKMVDSRDDTTEVDETADIFFKLL